MTDDVDVRIAKLEGELQALKASRGPKPAPQPQEPRDEGARVVTLLTQRGDLPDLRQTRRLHEIVKPHSPWPAALHDRFDPDRPFRAFGSALRWVMSMQRTPQPSSKYDLSFWHDHAKNFLRDRNCMASDLDCNAVVLACLATDVPYVAADPQCGLIWEVGLCEFGGVPASASAWRRVLDSGTILPPSQPARRSAPPSPVRVITGSGW